MQGDQSAPAGMMLVPHKPYMALGSLRQQLLYPVFDAAIIGEALGENDEAYAKQGLLDFPVKPHVGHADDAAGNGNGSAAVDGKQGNGADAAEAESSGATAPPPPSDAELLAVLETVRRGQRLHMYLLN